MLVTATKYPKYEWFQNRNRKWSPEQIAEIKRLYREGMSSRSIAGTLGIPRSTVLWHINRREYLIKQRIRNRRYAAEKRYKGEEGRMYRRTFLERKVEIQPSFLIWKREYNAEYSRSYRRKRRIV